VTFRSIVVPVVGIVLNLMSVGAAYGVLKLVAGPPPSASSVARWPRWSMRRPRKGAATQSPNPLTAATTPPAA